MKKSLTSLALRCLDGLMVEALGICREAEREGYCMSDVPRTLKAVRRVIQEIQDDPKFHVGPVKAVEMTQEK